MNAGDLIAFEARVAEAWEAGQIRGPVHLSGGNEEQLIRIFEQISRDDWVLATYRNHYHALLHGLNPGWLFAEIKHGRSMYISDPGRRFLSSAIVGGCLPIAVGIAAAIKRKGEARRVWCFVGDMAATTGAFHEALQYAAGHELPIKFVIENNGVSCDSPTLKIWGTQHIPSSIDYEDYVSGYSYSYERRWPHVGTGKFVNFGDGFR